MGGEDRPNATLEAPSWTLETGGEINGSETRPIPIPVTMRRRHTSIRQMTREKSNDQIDESGEENDYGDDSVAAPRVDSVSFFCGLAAGVTQAGLFNPFDRALYLSVKNRIPFMRRENFANPYQGFIQSVGHRALSGGLYYPLEQYFMTLIPPPPTDTDRAEGARSALYHFLAGTAAGSANAAIINPISAIKYKTWGRDVNQGMVREAINMLEKGGLRPFFNGLMPTMLRDLVFGGCYTFLRLELQYQWQLTSETQWTANLVAAALATVVSGPFNLARNMQYATRSASVADPVRVVLLDLYRETAAMPTAAARWGHLQQRLRIGWGTARVAVGMAFGHAVYDRLHGYYNDTRRHQLDHGSATAGSYARGVSHRQTRHSRLETSEA